MDTNPFRHMTWLKLVENVVSFKKVLAKAGRKEWDVRRWQEITFEMKRVQLVCMNNFEELSVRQQVCNRLAGARVTSSKIRDLDPYTKKPSFQGREGIVTDIFEGRLDNDGVYFYLPHVEVTFSDNGETCLHRLEDLKLEIESWWFSHTEHKPPKK